MARLASRGVISIRGPDAVQFMQVGSDKLNLRMFSSCDTHHHPAFGGKSVTSGRDYWLSHAHLCHGCCMFAQGMTTNDLRPLEQPGVGPIYTVLLTAKGKYLHDLFAYSLPGGPRHTAAVVSRPAHSATDSSR